MNYGMAVGLLCGASFLCAMYANESAGLALIGDMLGIMAFVTAGRLIRQYGQKVTPLSFGQACYMAIMTYFFAILLTAAIQYVYLRFFDAGRLAEQVATLRTRPEYMEILKQAGGATDTKTLTQNMMEMLGNPIQTTISLMWMNALMALALMLPTAWMGRTPKKTES